jgi:hypothetical protein
MVYGSQTGENWNMIKAATELRTIENRLKINKPACFTQPLNLRLYTTHIIIKQTETFQTIPNKQLPDMTHKITSTYKKTKLIDVKYIQMDQEHIRIN